MASNPMQRKVRNSFLLGLFVMLLVVILIGAVVFFLVVKPKMEEEKEEELQIYANVYRLKAGVSVASGEDITAAMVEAVEIPVQVQTTDFIASKRKNAQGELVNNAFPADYKSKIDLTEGTILTYNMLYTEELDNSLRYVEYNMLTMPTTIDIGNYIDIRLRMPNSQDLIVISKKEVQNLYGQTVGFNLTEQEILLLNSAIVEAYIMVGSELYLTSYIEPGIQTAAVYTYMPTNEVVTLMNMDTNIVSTAKNELVKLYQNIGAPIRGQIDATINTYPAEDKKFNVEAGMQAQIEAARKAREDYLAEMQGY